MNIWVTLIPAGLVPGNRRLGVLRWQCGVASISIHSASLPAVAAAAPCGHFTHEETVSDK